MQVETVQLFDEDYAVDGSLPPTADALLCELVELAKGCGNVRDFYYLLVSGRPGVVLPELADVAPAAQMHTQYWVNESEDSKFLGIPIGSSPDWIWICSFDAHEDFHIMIGGRDHYLEILRGATDTPEEYRLALESFGIRPDDHIDA